MTPPSTRSDRELLASFVKTADGAAFATLTERHLGLVFGTACRRTRSREMAQEAAQNTFCRLARHAARIWVGTSLAPWLHAVALREAGTLMRAEAARQRALDRLAAFTSPEDSAASPSAPPPGSEHLDEALAALPEAARRILILRYLQGLSLREVALEEDTSEEAARKRVTRALDRLTRLLARRGVTASAVTSCLAAAPMLWPGPSAAALAGRALKQAAAPAGASLSGLAGFVLSQWPVAAVFLLAAVPAAWPWGEFSGTSAAGKRLTGVFTRTQAGPNPDKSNATNASPAEVVEDLKRTLAEVNAKGWKQHDIRSRAGLRVFRIGFGENLGDASVMVAARRAVLDFSLEEIRAATTKLAGESASWIDGALFARWAGLMPEEAWQAALAHAERTGSDFALKGVLSHQARSHPVEAARRAAGHAPEKFRDGLVQTFLQPMIQSDPAGYLRLMESSGFAGRAPSLDAQCAALFPYAPDLALEKWKQKTTPGGYDWFPPFELAAMGKIGIEHGEKLAAFGADLPENPVLRRQCLTAASLVFFNTEPGRAADYLADSRDASVDTEWIANMTGLLIDWKGTDPDQAAQWLATSSKVDPDTQVRLARAAHLPLATNATSTPITNP